MIRVSVPRVDYSHRRGVAARAVLRVVQRDRPDLVEELRSGFGEALGFNADGSFNDASLNLVAEWCDKLRLGCPAVHEAAFFWVVAPEPPSDPNASPEDDDEAPQYRIPYVPGESRRTFLARASLEFLRRKKADEERGVIVAPGRVNPKHVEWFVRFQVHDPPEAFAHIADADAVDRQDVKRAVRAIASLLGLKLRPTRPGRPRGRRPCSAARG
jgi:hypothetical protein